MSKTHLSKDDFFERLRGLFDETRNKDHGSVFITHKRMTYDTTEEPSVPLADNPFADLNPLKPLPIILRATNGKTDKKSRSKNGRVNISTIVQADEMEAFFTRYADVCKSGMSGLKKRDRSKGKKKLKAKKKKDGL